VEAKEFKEYAQRIVEEAEKEGAILRLLGAVAFSEHCTKFRSYQEIAGRVFTDLDFAGFVSQSKNIKKALRNLGFEEDVQNSAVFGRSRLLFDHPKNGLHIDVFLGKLDFCHPIRWAGRLQADSPTIPLAELLLEKMQIVQLNEKDVIDTVMLIREHPMGDNDAETINALHIASLCAKDWGLWRTVTMNLGKVVEIAPKYSWLPTEDRSVVEERIRSLLDRIDAAPKTLAWKARSKVGDRMKWYKDVFEVEP